MRAVAKVTREVARCDEFRCENYVSQCYYWKDKSWLDKDRGEPGHGGNYRTKKKSMTGRCHWILRYFDGPIPSGILWKYRLSSLVLSVDGCYSL